MGLLEKLKNTFFEEEYIEVEEKPIAKKVETKPKKAEKLMKMEKVEKQVKKEEQEEVTETQVETKNAPISVSNYSDKELLKKDVSINYYDDSDFVDEKVPPKKEERSKLYGENKTKLYNNLDVVTDEHKPYSNTSGKVGFKPTPIISPIYGILDKNYKKEEVIDKKDKPSSYVSRRNADLDFVRNKAFGRLEDEMLANNISPKDDEKREDAVENNLLVDMTDSNSKPAVDKITIADAEEYFEDLGLEYNVDYKDARYEKASGRRSVRNKENHVEDSVDDNTANLEDNLFDLIDSIYENEGEE